MSASSRATLVGGLALAVLPMLLPAPAAAADGSYVESASCSTQDGTATAEVTRSYSGNKKWYPDVYVTRVEVTASVDGGRAAVVLRNRERAVARRVRVTDAVLTSFPAVTTRVEPELVVVVDPGATGRSCRIRFDL